MDNQTSSNVAACATIEEYQQKMKEAVQKIRVPHKLEIMVEEMDLQDDGTERWKPVMQDPRLGGDGHTYLTVYSKNDFIEKQNWYRNLDQRIKVIREVDPPTPADIERLGREQGIVFPVKPTTAPLVVDEQTNSGLPGKTQADIPEITQVQQNMQVQQAAPVAKKAKPKIITVGDVQIKYDGDRVYQRQWVRLTAAEAANIRIVNDSNNKIIPMANRHVEMKKWVVIENAEAESDVNDGEMEISDEQV